MKAKMKRRLEWARKHMPKKTRPCPNCGKPISDGEGHFVPPAFGESGFFICHTQSHHWKDL